MLPARLRLTREEVAEVVARGVRRGSRDLGARLVTTSGPTRLAIVVPAKEVKLAVDRHLLKRRLRAAVQGHSSLPSGYHLVIFAGRAALEWTPEQLFAQLSQLFHDL